MIKHRIAGDYLIDGRRTEGQSRTLSIAIVNGRAYELGYDGEPDLRDAPLTLDADGFVDIGVTVSFAPDAGELDRIGRSAFGA